jgi:CheY-like chemotaxis protein
MNQPAPTENIVVYVDDDPDDLDLVREGFNKYSRQVTVVCFESGSEALSYFSANAHKAIPCLIILDINMPILSGKELLVQVRQLKNMETVPIVLFSTSSMPDDKKFAKQYGATVITKPLSVQQMQSVTNLFIDHCKEQVQKKIRK